MFCIKNRFFKKPVIILVILSIVLITGFINFWSELIYQRNIIETLVRYVQLSNLKRIDQKMRQNYHILQGLLLAKTWEDKFAMYGDKEVAKYIGPNSLNTKLLLRAGQIARRYRINLEAQYMLLPYLYKEKNNELVMGFIPLDCAGINIVKANKN